MIMLHLNRLRAEISQSIVIPFEFDDDRAVKLLSFAQLNTLIDFIALLLSLGTAKAEANDKSSIIIAPYTILFKLNLEQKTQLIVGVKCLFDRCKFLWEVSEIDEHGWIDELASMGRNLILYLILAPFKKCLRVRVDIRSW